MKEERGEYVKVHIPFDKETAKTTRCVGENPWAEPTGEDGVLILRNEPLHPDYSWGDKVKAEIIGGRRVVVGKVEAING